VRQEIANSYVPTPTRMTHKGLSAGVTQLTIILECSINFGAYLSATILRLYKFLRGMVEGGKFNLDAKGWLLAQCRIPMPQEEGLEAPKDKPAGLSQVLVGRELPGDGEPQLHAYP